MSKRNRHCEDFGRRVRDCRTILNYSQEELAARTGIHRTYIGGIERGERNPTLLMIHRIAEALGISPAVLLNQRSE